MLACFVTFMIALPLRAQTGADVDLPKLIADAAKYQSGQNAQAIRAIEQLVRDAAGRPTLRAELEASLVRLLAPSATFEARRFACQSLAVVGTDASLPALAELLKGEETVGIACLALSGQRTPRAAEILRSALPGARGRARLQLIGALGNHQDASAVKTLADLARDPDADVAAAAILAISKMNGPDAHAAIVKLRKEAPSGLAGPVTEATLRMAEQLAAAGDRKAAADIYKELLASKTPTNVRRGALAALLPLDDDAGQQRILDTISGADPALVPVAIARVGLLESDGASKTFAALLPKLPPSSRVWMIEALAVRGGPVVRDAIRAEVSAADAAVRLVAVFALGKLDDASCVGLLAKALSNAQSPEERRAVELALAGLRGGAATDQALIAELRQASDVTKVSLFSILTRRGARAAVPALLAEADGSDLPTVRAAFQALGRIATPDDVPALLEKLANLKIADVREDAERAAARAMAKMANVSRRSEAVRRLLAKSPGIEARCSLLRLLPVAADADALAALTAARTDKEPRIRDAAVRALAAWPDATGWDPLLAIFQQPENETHRALALRALTGLARGLNARPDAALIHRYRLLLAGARDDGDRKLILGSLADAAHPDALQLVLPLLSNAGVRAEAEVAVKKIAASIQARHPQAAKAALERLQQTKP
jgi:HEAT repeat protein